jgi:hypothetical protein
MNTVETALHTGAIRDIVEHADPVAWLYLGLQPPYPIMDAEEDLELRWRSAATRLAAQGADDATLAAIGRELARLGPRPSEVAVFAAGGQILLVQPIPGDTRFDRAGYGRPPTVVPLLGWRQRHPAYVLAVTDRTGADVTAVARGCVHGTTWRVVGPDDEIERNAPGGWSQPRYQRRAEDSWRHNAAAVADVAVRALSSVDASLLLVAGDVRAVQLLRQRLTSLPRNGVTIRHLPGGRSPDGSVADRAAATTTAVEQHAADRTVALLAALGRHGGPHGTAVHGVRDTLAALAAGRVQTLFVVDDPDDDRVAWYGPDLLCAAEPVPGTAAGRLVDVAVRAALHTDADVRVLSAGEVSGNLAALCRFRTE